MGHGKNALKLPGDHIDFFVKLKIILSPLFHAQKKTFILKSFWSHLFCPAYLSDTIQRI